VAEARGGDTAALRGDSGGEGVEVRVLVCWGGDGGYRRLEE
jgi:hypothetical protein